MLSLLNFPEYQLKALMTWDVEPGLLMLLKDVPEEVRAAASSVLSGLADGKVEVHLGMTCPCNHAEAVAALASLHAYGVVHCVRDRGGLQEWQCTQAAKIRN